MALVAEGVTLDHDVVEQSLIDGYGQLVLGLQAYGVGQIGLGEVGQVDLGGR